MSKLTGTRRPAGTDISQQYPRPAHLRYDFSDPNTRRKIIQAFPTSDAEGFLQFGSELLRLRDTLNWNAFPNASWSDVAALSRFRDALLALAAETSQANKVHAASLFFILLLNISDHSNANVGAVTTQLSQDLKKALFFFDFDEIAKAVPEKENPDAKRSFLGYAMKEAITAMESSLGALRESNKIFILANDEAIERSLGSKKMLDAIAIKQADSSSSLAGFMYLTSDLTHFFVGPSGSGKTSRAILASGSKSIVIYCLPSTVRFDPNRHIDHAEALRRLAVLVAQAVTGGDYASPDTQINAIRLSENWRHPLEEDRKIHVILDEASDYAELAYTLSIFWTRPCRDWLSKQFRCKTEQLFLSIIGDSKVTKYLPTCMGSIPLPYITFSS